MKTALAAALFAIVCAPAQARTLQIVGTAGYLSEWEIKASADPELSEAAGEHRGPISWKHVGLCAANGPVEKSGNIKFRISGWGPFSRIDATMSFDQTQCTYSGSYAAQTRGTMDCSDAKGIPITLTIKVGEPEPRGALARVRSELAHRNGRGLPHACRSTQHRS